MATVTTLAPIAAQLARAVSLEALFPRGAIDTVLRDHRSGAQSGEAELPEEVKAFFGRYCVVVRAAAQLLGAPAFDSLARHRTPFSRVCSNVIHHELAFSRWPKAWPTPGSSSIA